MSRCAGPAPSRPCDADGTPAQQDTESSMSPPACVACTLATRPGSCVCVSWCGPSVCRTSSSSWKMRCLSTSARLPSPSTLSFTCTPQRRPWPQSKAGRSLGVADMRTGTHVCRVLQEGSETLLQRLLLLVRARQQLLGLHKHTQRTHNSYQLHVHYMRETRVGGGARLPCKDVIRRLVGWRTCVACPWAASSSCTFSSTRFSKTYRGTRAQDLVVHKHHPPAPLSVTGPSAG